MRNLSIILIALVLGTSMIQAKTTDWGATGHRTVGQVAEGYLKGKTKRNIDKLLNGQSLALVSTFGDDIKSDKRYNEFYTWHYVNMPSDVSYQDSEKNSKGDLVTGIEKCQSVILDKNASNEDKAFYLKMMVHLIGDLHQPMHAGRQEDKGGNTIAVKWFGSRTNLHTVWDSKMINHFDMSYTELAKNAAYVSKDQVKQIQSGTLIDWVNDTHNFSIKVYGTVVEGENLSYEYMYQNFGLAQSQLQKAGIRLAKVLNDMFN